MPFVLKRTANGWVGDSGATVKLGVRSGKAATIVTAVYNAVSHNGPDPQIEIAPGREVLLVALTGVAPGQLMKVVEIDPDDNSKTQTLQFADWDKTHPYTYCTIEGRQ
jgi:hypothetical protein